MAQDENLRRITVSNDDGDVYVESSGDGSEIVLKTEKVRVDGDVYCDGSQVGLSARIDALKTEDDALDERIDTLNATNAQLKATDETLKTHIASLNATDAELKGVDDGLSSRIDALRDIYVNELNVTDKQLIVTDATLGSRIDDLNATQFELKGVDAGLSSRIDALESAHTENERVDDQVASLIDALNATDAALLAADEAFTAADANLSSRIDKLNATDAQLRATEETLKTRIASLNATNAELRGVDDGLLSRIDALRDVYVNELNVTDKQLIVTDSKLGSRIDSLNATQYELKGVYAGLSSRIDALDAAKTALQLVDANVTALISSLNATDAIMHAMDTTLARRIDSLTPLKCISPGGNRLQFNGMHWFCVCEPFWSGDTCEVPPPWTQQQKLMASDKSERVHFGTSVSISGQYFVVGAYLDDNNGFTDSGSAYVFVRSDTTWTQQQKLTASDGTASDHFGVSVSISGDYCIVGANGNDARKGSAYVFVRSGLDWNEQQKLTASDASTGDYFGTSVSISGDYAVVGAYADDNSGGTGSGSAYVFVRSDTTWTQQQKLTASDSVRNSDYFGISVSISGDYCVIGAYGHSSYRGSAYVFVRSGTTTWVQQQKLSAQDAASRDNFGISVSLSGNYTIIGADGEDGSRGSAYVFARHGTTWTQQQKLIPIDGTPGEQFSSSVSLSDKHVLVGSHGAYGSRSNSGCAYVFARNGTTWTQQQRLAPLDGVSGDAFGISVAISRDYAVIGARNDDNVASPYSGSAYLFASS